ncbi:MAG: gamma-butyrobetaine hydroxylase-like domain-containing protein, partial [Planctomycetota bacterium]
EAPAWDDVKDVRATNAAGVGAYAIRFTFTDGHDSGIYAWTVLRENDPADRDDVDGIGRPKAT